MSDTPTRSPADIPAAPVDVRTDALHRPDVPAPAASVDAYATNAGASAARFLLHLNPLAKVAAVVPGMVGLVFVRDLATPILFLVLAYALVLIGARLSVRAVLFLLVAVPAFLALLAVGFALWTDPAGVAHDVVVLRIGDWTLYGAAMLAGLATALRLGAILALSLVPGLTITGPDLARSLVQQLRLPYRLGYTAIAAFRFVPRFRYELDVIRAAHRVRGAADGRGPIAAARRRVGYVVPLLAAAIRHAERVSLAMDARAFGAYPDRTERHVVPFRVRDVVFVVAFWVVTVLLFVVGAGYGS